MRWGVKASFPPSEICVLPVANVLKLGEANAQGRALLLSVESHQVLRVYVYIISMKRSREKEMATHFSILAWRIPGTEEPDGLPSMGSHRVRQE